jgi:hypothetical protein
MGRYEGKIRGVGGGGGEGCGGVEGKNGWPPGQNTAARVRGRRENILKHKSTPCNSPAFCFQAILPR